MVYFALPPAGSDLADAIDPDELARIARGEFVPADLPEVKRLARECFERFKGAKIQPSRLWYYCLRADDHVDMISVGPRGGWRLEWRFGNLSGPAAH